MVVGLSSTPPASSALQQKGTATRERTATVAFAQERENDGFDIPSVEDILCREEDAGLFSDFTDHLCASVSKVAQKGFSGGFDDEGCQHGAECTVEAKSGAIISGRMHHGFLHGKVEMQFPDSFKFQGIMHKNQLTGEAVLTHKCAQYRGQVVDGAAHGVGAMVLEDGTTYEGQWSGGVRHGKGTITFPGDFKHFYSGQWVQDEKHGWGTMQYPSGSLYEGEWTRDQKHGFGTMYWASSMERYRGDWKRNKPDGVGEHVWYRGAAGAKNTRAALVRCNRYVGMMSEGQRHGEGTIQYSSGARYEGQWEGGAKKGEGMYVFEDNSVWTGTWAKDQPIEASSTQPFAAQSNCPKIYIDDLLEREFNPAFASKGVEHVLMCNNSEIRALYDLYSQQDVPWMHDGDYHTALEKRCSFGLLSMHIWQMMIDGCVLAPVLPLCTVNSILKQCCRAPAVVLERRKTVQQSPNYHGVWTFNLPDHSPYREILYPEFCAALVRIAAARFSTVQGLNQQLKKLVVNHLLPLHSKYHTAPLYKLNTDAPFVQYLSLMNPVLKIIFHAISSRVKVPHGDEPSSIATHHVRSSPVEDFQMTAKGLAIIPDLRSVGNALLDAPVEIVSHPLDLTPKSICDSSVISIRQLLFLLQHCGFVGADGPREKCLPYETAVSAIRRACFPSDSTSFMDTGSTQPVKSSVRSSDALLCGIKLTYLEFVMSCIAIAAHKVTKDDSLLAKVRAFIDGPRGFLADVLRATKITLPPELSEHFSYLCSGGTTRSNKASISTRRSRKSACGDSVVSGGSSQASETSKIPEGKLSGGVSAHAAQNSQEL